MQTKNWQNIYGIIDNRKLFAFVKTAFLIKITLVIFFLLFMVFTVCYIFYRVVMCSHLLKISILIVIFFETKVLYIQFLGLLLVHYLG